ncbi:MAG TPA: protein kinase [Kofleriaceae bacterium]
MFAEGLVGITLDGRYRLDALLGEGGMGAVFRAHHLAMDRKVAVKLLKPHLTSDETALQRFAREARSTQRVDSPHAVKVLDFGVTPLRDYYMVLEYLDGRTVQRELDIDGAFAPARAVHIATHALHALGAAHAIGLVHRDVKPDNLLLLRVGDDPDYTKVLDFGVAKLMAGAAPASDRSALALTGEGTVFGTPEYMSPEQACGLPLDGRSDLYALAATLFAMLTGAAPFSGATAIELLTHHARTPPPHLADVAPVLAPFRELDALLQRCLAKQRDARPATAADLAKLLAAIVPTLSRKPGASGEVRTRARSTLGATGFVAPLPSALAETLTPPSGNAPGDDFADLVDAPPRNRALLVAMGVAVAAVAVAVFSVAHHRGHRDAAVLDAPHAAVGSSSAAAGSSSAAAGSSSAAAPDAALPDAPLSIPAPGSAAAPTPTPALPRPTPPPTFTHHGSAAAQHLRNAEAALAADNRLQQLYEANTAVTADPANARARWLLGDALIKGGDLDRGCAELRKAHTAAAHTRAKAAGCSD